MTADAAYIGLNPWRVSVIVLGREVLPAPPASAEPEEHIAARVRELAGMLGEHVEFVPEWKGHLTCSARAADRLLAARDAHQRAAQAAESAAQERSLHAVPDDAEALAMRRTGLTSPAAGARMKAA